METPIDPGEQTAESSQDGEPPDHPEAKQGVLKKIIGFLDFRKPGTKEDLDQEIQELLEEGEEHGLISPLEERMINSILEFHDTYASEIMTPVAEMVACDISMPLSDLVELVIESGFTRIPVFTDNPDRVVGIVHVKDLLRFCAGSECDGNVIEGVLRPVNFAPENKPIVDMLREFQRTKVHIAMVVDEFGAVRGLVTLEDILEEIVGEIDDEYDHEEPSTFEVMEDGSVQVHGWEDIETLEEYYKIRFPKGPYESVGGLVVHLLGRLGRPGDSVTASELCLEVVNASTRHIKLLRVTRSCAEDQTEEKGACGEVA